MKMLDVDPELKEIRSIVELAVPAWHSGLTLKQSTDLERVQRVAVQVILSDSNTGRSSFTYASALEELNLDRLVSRREDLCLTFAKKTLKSRHRDIFVDQHMHDTRGKTKYFEQRANTGRFRNSPVNYLTRLLNGDK